MKITLTNTKLIVADVDLDVLRRLDAETAPMVKGCRYNQAYRSGHWDGREHLIKRGGEQGEYYIPVGLLDDLIRLAPETPAIDDQRRISNYKIKTQWNDTWSLRDYQVEAVDSVADISSLLDENGRLSLTAGKGLLRLPTRSGKTVIAAGIIHKLKRRSLFLVQSEMLLSQTINLFEKVLQVPIGIVGAGKHQAEDVTVASVQTLTRRMNKPETQKFLSSFDVVFFDECHHLEGKAWRSVLDSVDAMWKLGLSATIYFDEEGGIPKGSIWMRAATGGVLYDLEPSDLIRMGYLVQPIINMVPVRSEEVQAASYQDAYQQGVVEHINRNQMVAEYALKYCQDGLAVLVVASRLDHVKTLQEMLEAAGLRVGCLIGATPAPQRREIVQMYNQGDVDVLLGTVFGEGVDIPKIECVINAEAGKSKKATMQRFRNLTPSPGKDTAVFIDFMDFTNRYLAKHSLERLRTYRENEMFSVKVIGELDE